MAASIGQRPAPQSLAVRMQAQGWQSDRRAMTQHFLQDGEAARQRFDAALSTQRDGAVNLAFAAAVDRINLAGQTKARAAPVTIAGKVWAPPATIYAGASSIDLANGTITLGDGTRITMRTAAKVDVTA